MSDCNRPLVYEVIIAAQDGVQPLTTPAQPTDYASVHSPFKFRPEARSMSPSPPPRTGNKAAFPVFSGFIHATGSLGDNVHASYLGLNAKTTDLGDWHTVTSITLSLSS